MVQKRRTISVIMVVLFLIFIGMAATGFAAQQGPVRVTARLDVSPASYSGNCPAAGGRIPHGPALITFRGYIAVDQPTTVQYKFIRSDNAESPVQTLNFPKAGRQEVTTTWQLSGTGLPEYSGWEAIEVISPASVQSNKAEFMISCAGLGQQAGADVRGFSFSAGYNGAYLHYSETNPTSGGVLDKDTGWLNGATVEARYDSHQVPFFVRANFDYLTSNSATYTGALQNGTPLIMKTPETIYKAELNWGVKIWNPGHFTLAPYLGIGYRDWERGRDVLPDYTEHYSWGYGSIGANLAYRVADRLLVGLDAALWLPFCAQMKTNIDHLIDTATFHLESRPGYRFQVPVSYDIYKGKAYRIFTFLTPYYERWNVGRSPNVIVTLGGVPVGVFLEPTSHTDLYGVKAGLGVNF
jgi:hypothetical protein